MRRLPILLAGLLAALPLCAQQVDSGPSQGDHARDLLVPRDSVVAKVNGEIILGNQVYSRVARELDGLPPDKAMELWTKTLRDLVEERVIQMAAKAEGIHVEDAEVDRELAKQVRRKGSKERMCAELSQVGMSWEEYRQQVREDMIERELVRSRLGFGQRQVTPASKMPPDIFVTPAEIQRYYAEHQADYCIPEEVKARLIVISFTPGNREERLAEAQSLVRQIGEGADMALLALWYSQERAADGGLYEWSPRERFPQELADILFGLGRGELGPIVETSGQFVLARCEDRRDLRRRRLEEDDVQEEVREILSNEKVSHQLARIKRGLIEEAFIEPADLFPR